MRCFICLAQTLNFTQTAEQLFMTQQAVSRQISQLEEELGFPLLIRSKHGVTLTPEGERCYMLFTDFIRNYDDLRARILDEGGAPQSIRIGFQNWLDYGDGPANILARVQKRMPDLEVLIEMYSPGRLNDLLERQMLDVVLMQRRFVLSPAGLSSVELFSCSMVLFCASTFSGCEEELRAQPLIIDAFDCEAREDTIARAHREIKRCGLAPSEIVVMPNRDSVYSAVESGRGITTGTTIGQALQDPYLRACPIAVQEQLLCLWQTSASSRAVQTYVKCARQEYQQTGPEDLPGRG